MHFCWNQRLRHKNYRNGTNGSGISKMEYCKCAICGEIKTGKEMSVHHILPKNIYPELAEDARNQIEVCKQCHAELHKNWLRLGVMAIQKAKEIGVRIDDKLPRGIVLR